jgi:oxygen-independent coproporphyrinogen-3 oxidase
MCAPSRRDRGDRARVPGRTVSTIFFGGGTPSLMQPGTVGAILEAIAKQWSIAPDVEVTLEANPTSVEATRFRGYRMAGVNRVSLGVQALNDAELKTLGRLHTAQEALDAVAIARKVFERYSFDLIYARPGRRRRPGHQSSSARSRKPPSISRSINLPSSRTRPFAALHAAGKLVTPDEDVARTLYDTRRRSAPPRPAGLRDLQPRTAGRRMPAQSRLLARTRICRHRPGRAWPARHRRASAAPPRPSGGRKPG